MTRSAFNRAARRDERVQRKMRARTARWVLVAQRLASAVEYPQRSRWSRIDAGLFVEQLRDALALDPREALREVLDVLDAAQFAIRTLRRLLSDAPIAELSRGDEVADRARQLVWSDYDQRTAGHLDMSAAQWAYARRCIVVRTSWVAISSDDGASWVWDADSADTYRRVRELQGDEYADTSARRYLRLPVLGVAREVRDGE